MNKSNFLQECERQLIEHFELIKKNKLDEVMKHRIQGFINAGEFLGVITREEAIKAIDDTHFKIFDMSKEQRKERREIIKSIIKGDNESILDIPAIDRLKTN